jgi:hypothetical protein
MAAEQPGAPMTSADTVLPNPDAARLRIAFVGQHVYFRQCSLEHPAGGLEPAFLDFRAGVAPEPLLERLLELDPDIVLVFRPEIVPPGLLAPLRGLTLGYLTEPLPRGEDWGHPDLEARMSWLEQVDAGNFDRIISFDPLIAETAERVLPVWRSLPIPVSDSLYMEPRTRSVPPSLLFIGRPTEHREALLAPVKRDHPIVHIGHGLFGEQLQRVLARADVQLNIHNNPYPSFENRVTIALAAGHLTISEPLSPRHELEPGVDYLEFASAEQLERLLEALRLDPNAFADVQAAGHRQAERFRASRVYPALVREALADVKVRGCRRQH